MTAEIPAPEWVPQACTLPTAEQPLRLAEFDELFARHTRAAYRVRDGHLRLTLTGPPDLADSVRDLAARESECCSFFTFTTMRAGDRVILDIEVPDAYTGVLDALAARSRR